MFKRYFTKSSGLVVSLSVSFLLAGCSGCSKGSSTSVLDNSLSKNNLIATNTIEKGHVECANGGVQIDTGFDENEDGALNAGEVKQTKIICIAGQGLDSLIRLYSEPAGEHCEIGGKRIQIGLDSNIDSELSEDEVTDTQYFCDTVINNPSSLVAVVEELAGQNCAAGGKQIKTGIDINSNGQLDELEVTDSSYLCNGEKGVDGATTRSLQSITCSGPLESMTDMLWSYEIHQLTSGDAVVTASIYGIDTTVGSLAFYSGQELANGVKPAVTFVHDVIAPNNYGSWQIYLDDIQGRAFVAYNDPDQVPITKVWSMTTDKCSTVTFE